MSGTSDSTASMERLRRPNMMKDPFFLPPEFKTIGICPPPKPPCPPMMMISPPFDMPDAESKTAATIRETKTSAKNLFIFVESLRYVKVLQKIAFLFVCSMNDCWNVFDDNPARILVLLYRNLKSSRNVMKDLHCFFILEHGFFCFCFFSTGLVREKRAKIHPLFLALVS